MSNLAKVPNNDETHWEYIDIFLFRNGDHAAPPRKYHLKYDELDNWTKTLKNIAQSQYGTKQSVVDIYKLNGEKVTTPIEITNKNYYVTVLPHDTFIPAGYNEYILKASRSREKRLGKIKKTLKDTLSEPGEIKEDAARKLPQSDTAENTTVSAEIPLGPQDNVVEGKMPRKPLTNSPRIPTYSSLHKKNNLPSSTVVPKASLKRADNLPKKNFKLNPGRIVGKDPIPANLNNAVKAKNKEITRIGKFNSLVNTPKKAVTNPTLSGVQYTPTIIDENDTTADNPIIDDVIFDKELIVVKNPDSVVMDTNKSSLSRPIIVLSDIPTFPLLEKNKPEEKSTTDITKNDAENIHRPDLVVCKVQTDPKTDEVNNNNLLDENELSETNITKTNKSQSTDNLIAIIDKGDVVDFNLKLELKKCNGLISTQYSIDNKMHTLAENPSQPERNNVTGEFLETRSNTRKELNDRNPKFIIIQCSCCGHENVNEIFHKIETSTYSDNKNYIVVPNPDNYENMERCNCNQEPNTRLSVVNPPKKVDAETAIIAMTAKAKTGNGTAVEVQTIDLRNSQSILRNNTTTNEKKVAANDNNLMTETTANEKSFDGVDFKTQIKYDKASLMHSKLQRNPSMRDNKQVMTNYSLNSAIIGEPSPSNINNSSGIKEESMKTPVISQYANTSGIQNNTSLQPRAADIKNSFGVKDESVKTPVNSQYSNISRIQKNNSLESSSAVVKKSSGIKDESVKPSINSVHSNTTELEIQNTESFNLRKNASNMSKPFIDNSTQTEWDCLLLEAKRHEDGRYSFHIPPLSVLKYYFW